MRIRVRFTLPLVVVSVSLAMGALSAAPAFAAEGGACPNEQLREESNVNPSTSKPYSTELPDCRAYEQVTPVEKGQALVSGVNGGIGSSPFQQASVNGEGIMYGTVDALPGSLDGHYLLLGENVAFREEEGWFTTPLAVPQLLEEGQSSVIESGGVFAYFSPTLSCGLEETIEPLTALPAGESPGESNLYVWSRASDGYTLVSNARGLGSSFEVFGASNNCERVVFSAAGHLYEWYDGTLTLLSSAVTAPRTVGSPLSLFGAVSETPARVFYSAGGAIFMEEKGGVTVEVSASKTATRDSGATFQVASGGGSQVVFTAPPGIATNGASKAGKDDLYAYDVENGTLSDLTPDGNVSDAKGAEVQGVLGISENASYVYFAALGQLVSGHGKSEAENESKEEASVYVWHAGHIAYIAQLETNPTYNNETGGEHADLMSRSEDLASNVTPDGEYLLFTATTKPTGYENRSTGGTLESELFLYSAQSEKVVCVSCDPSGEPSRGFATTSMLGFNDGYVARNLSESGDQVFFTSRDHLVAGAGSENAYEWEREGVESCTAEVAAAATEYSGGCIYLLAGNGSVLDASANGENVFITTNYRLVRQDLDGSTDVYDARVDGGLKAPRVSECSGEECQGALSGPLSLTAPPSESPPAEGNAQAPAEAKAVVKTPAKQKALTRAQKLANALKACKQESKKKRAACEAQARKRFGAKTKKKVKRSTGKGGK